jgi:hypothetical protein
MAALLLWQFEKQSPSVTTDYDGKFAVLTAATRSPLAM